MNINSLTIKAQEALQGAIAIAAERQQQLAMLAGIKVAVARHQSHRNILRVQLPA